MLVISRLRDEQLYIGDNIVVTVVDIRGDKVRLGVEAPCDVPVHRKEVYEAIQRENAKLAKPSSPPVVESCQINAELLAAAKLVDQVFTRMNRSDDITDSGCMGDDEFEAWNAVKAAIAKLTNPPAEEIQ